MLWHFPHWKDLEKKYITFIEKINDIIKAKASAYVSRLGLEAGDCKRLVVLSPGH